MYKGKQSKCAAMAIVKLLTAMMWVPWAHSDLDVPLALPDLDVPLALPVEFLGAPPVKFLGAPTIPFLGSRV